MASGDVMASFDVFRRWLLVLASCDGFWCWLLCDGFWCWLLVGDGFWRWLLEMASGYDFWFLVVASGKASGDTGGGEEIRGCVH